jgi:glucosamine-6-phosphate deaminase
MRLIIEPNFDGVVRRTAEDLAAKIAAFEPTPSKPLFVIAIPAGPTGGGVFKHLASMHQAGSLSLQHCATFCMDEYVGMPRDHMHSQHTFMWTHFYSQVDLKREHCHSLDGNAEDLTAECDRYEAAIAKLGGLDYIFFSTGARGFSLKSHFPTFVRVYIP